MQSLLQKLVVAAPAAAAVAAVAVVVVAVAVVAVAAAAVTQMALEAQELDLMVKPPSVLEWRELLKASSCTIWRNRCYFCRCNIV